MAILIINDIRFHLICPSSCIHCMWTDLENIACGIYGSDGVKGRAVAIEINLSVWCICMWGRPFECVCTWLSCKFGCKYTVAMIYINDAYMYLFAHYTYTLKYCKTSYVFLSASVACQSTSRWPHTYMQTVGIALVLKAHSKSSRFCGGSSWCLCIRTNVYIHIHGRQRGKIASA